MIPDELRLAVEQELALGWLRKVVESATALEEVKVNDNSEAEYMLATPLGTVTVVVDMDTMLRALDFR